MNIDELVAKVVLTTGILTLIYVVIYAGIQMFSVGLPLSVLVVLIISMLVVLLLILLYSVWTKKQLL